jgi:hypothetical protein
MEMIDPQRLKSALALSHTLDRFVGALFYIIVHGKRYEQ